MPVIKPSGIIKSQNNFFYLFGEKETGLTKAFAYLLGENQDLLFSFLRELGILINKSQKRFREAEIRTERYYDKEGRTDIEIRIKGLLHVVIEAKVGENKVTKQNTQYLSIFDNDDEPQKVMCFISQIHEHKYPTQNQIIVKNINWIFIDRLIDEPIFLRDPIVRNFQLYLRRYFTMKAQKEILIQDLGNEKEIDNYRNYNIYRRNVVFGSPLYFCPYFTRSSKQPEGEGASYISRVLGIISCKPEEILSYKEELESFCSEIENGQERKDLMKKWIDGIARYTEDDEFSFFFLDNPIQLPGTALKDSSSRNQKGRGKGWIASMITQNRSITFADLLTHLS